MVIGELPMPISSIGALFDVLSVNMSFTYRFTRLLVNFNQFSPNVPSTWPTHISWPAGIQCAITITSAQFNVYLSSVILYYKDIFLFIIEYIFQQKIIFQSEFQTVQHKNFFFTNSGPWWWYPTIISGTNLHLLWHFPLILSKLTFLIFNNWVLAYKVVILYSDHSVSH